MADYDAQIVRAVAIELREKLLDLHLSEFPIYTTVKGWTLNGYDAMLPTPFEVKTQLDAYKSLKIKLLQLSEWAVELQHATADDTLTYPPPPMAFDGAGTFTGDMTFDGGGEQT